MELKFGKEDIKGILENYYRDYEDFDGVVSIGCFIGTDFGRNEFYEKADLSITATGKLNVFGREVPIVRRITEEEVKGIFRSAIEKEGYTVINVLFDYGLNTSCVGYGRNETSIKEPYFNGINISVRNKIYVK